MSDVVDFPSVQSKLIGRHIKVSRHGESLWLQVKSVRPGGNLVAIVDNRPVCWPESLGDAVEIRPDEIIRILDET